MGSKVSNPREGAKGLAGGSTCHRPWLPREQTNFGFFCILFLFSSLLHSTYSVSLL